MAIAYLPRLCIPTPAALARYTQQLWLLLIPALRRPTGITCTTSVLIIPLYFLSSPLATDRIGFSSQFTILIFCLSLSLSQVGLGNLQLILQKLQICSWKQKSRAYMLIMYMMYGISKTDLNKIRHSYHHLKYVFNQNTWNNQQEISILASWNVVCYL